MQMDQPKKQNEYDSYIPLLIGLVEEIRKYYREYKFKPAVIVYTIVDMIVDGYGGGETLETIGDSSPVFGMSGALKEFREENNSTLYSNNNNDYKDCNRIGYVVDKLAEKIDYYCSPIILVYIVTDYSIKNNINLLDLSNPNHIKTLIKNVYEYYEEHKYGCIAAMLLDFHTFRDVYNDVLNEHQIEDPHEDLDKDEQIKLLADLLSDYHQSGHDYTLLNSEALDDIVPLYILGGG